jgi:biopolymer transport protein ExbB/TolQ
MDTILEYLDKGGWMMYVILVVSLFGVTVFLERAYHLFLTHRLDARAFLNGVLGHVEARGFRNALDACKVRSRHPLVEVMRAGILRANRREREIERAMEREMLIALPTLHKRLGFLGFLANISTLLGLLGTIFGLITAFTSVSAASAAERQAALADGISQAMYTTAFGIIVAVPLLFFHHLLSARQEQIVEEIEGGATALIVSLSAAADAPEGES